MAKRKASKHSIVLIDENLPPAHMREPVLRGKDDTRGEDVLREAVVEATDWKDPDDTDSARARGHGARSIHGWRSVRTIDVLHRHSPREITAAHVKAAGRLLSDYEIGIEGASNGRSYDRVDGAASGGISGIRLDALRRYREAMDVCGVEGARVLGWVVIDNLSVAKIADKLGLHRDRAHGRLYAALERLREHYWPPRRDVGVQPLVGVYEGDERVGRWRVG